MEEKKKFPLIKIRTDRADGFRYFENDKYYCILRDSTRTALYDKNTNELIKKFNEQKHVRCVRFWGDHLLFLKTNFANYYLYDIDRDSVVWEKKYTPNRDIQEKAFQLTREGIIYDIDANVKRPDTCRMIRIDPWKDTVETFEIDAIPRFVELFPNRRDDHFFVQSMKRVWDFNTQDMSFEEIKLEGNVGIECCDLDGNIVYSQYLRTEGNYDIRGVFYHNREAGVIIPIDEYMGLSNEYIMWRLQESLAGNPVEEDEITSHLRNVCFDYSGNYVFLRFSLENGFWAVKVFDIDKKRFVYENYEMKDFTNISCLESGVYLLDNKKTYKFDFEQL